MNTLIRNKGLKGAFSGLVLLGVLYPQSGYSAIEATYSLDVEGGGSVLSWSDAEWVGGPGYPSLVTDKASVSTATGAGGNAGLRYDISGLHIGEFELVAGSVNTLQIYSLGSARSLTVDKLVMNGSNQLQLIGETGAELSLSVGHLEINSGSMELGVGTGVTGVALTAGSSDIAGALRVSNGGQTVALGDVMLRDGLITLGGRGLNGVASVTALNGTGYIQVYSNSTDHGLEGTLNFQNGAGTTASFAGFLRDYSDSAGSNSRLTVNKSGGGTQILEEANDYSGGTTISDGILAVTNTTGSGLGSGGVVVSGSGTLAGSGFIALGMTPEGAGETIVVEAGGNVAPGAASDAVYRTLTLSGEKNADATILEMQSDSSFDFRLGAMNESDQLSFTGYREGGLLLDGSGISVNVTGAQVGNYLLFAFDDIAHSELEALAALLRAGSGFGSYEWSFLASGNGIELQLIPEPGSVALCLTGVAMAAFWIRRKR